MCWTHTMRALCVSRLDCRRWGTTAHADDGGRHRRHSAGADDGGRHRRHSAGAASRWPRDINGRGSVLGSRGRGPDASRCQRAAAGDGDGGGDGFGAEAPPSTTRRATWTAFLALGCANLGLADSARGTGFETDISLSSSPEDAAEGQEVTLTFTIQASGVPLGVDDLEAYSLFGVKPHKVHVKIYDQDLEGIEVGHVHPEEFPGGMTSQQSGQYVVKFAFPNPGNFNVTLQCAPIEIFKVTKSIPQAVVLAEFPFRIF